MDTSSQPCEWTKRANQMLFKHRVSRNAERVLWYLFEQCGNGPGETCTSYTDLAKAGITSESSARRAIQRLEEMGIAQVDRDASRPGALVVHLYGWEWWT